MPIVQIAMGFSCICLNKMPTRYNPTSILSCFFKILFLVVFIACADKDSRLSVGVFSRGIINSSFLIVLYIKKCHGA